MKSLTSIGWITLLPILLLSYIALGQSIVIATPVFQSADTQASADALFEEGVTLLADGDSQGALAKLLQARNLYRDLSETESEADALTEIGLAYYALGQLEDALESQQEALTLAEQVDSFRVKIDALENMIQIYANRGQYEKTIETLESMLATQREISDPVAEATTLNNIGYYYDLLGHYEQAAEFHQQALELRQAIGDLEGVGMSLHNIALLYDRKGQYEKALATYQQALAIHREIGNRAGEGATLNNIGGVNISLGRYTEALTNLQQALSIRQEVGDQIGEGDTLNHIGNVYNDQGQYTDALTAYQQALTIYRNIGHRVGEGDSLNAIGLAYHYQGQYEEALAYFQQALMIRQDIGDQAGESITLSNMGLVYNHLRQYEKALAVYQQALEIQRDIGARAREARTLTNMGIDYQYLGQYEKSLAAYQQALIIQQEIGDRSGENSTLHNLGRTLLNVGRYEEAIANFEQALAIQRDIGDPWGMGYTLNVIGVVEAAQGQYADGIATLEQALAIRSEIGHRGGEVETLSNIGVLYERQDNIHQAINYYRRAVEVIESILDTVQIEELKSSLAGGYTGVYQRLIFLLLQENQIDEAFNYSERVRARSFLDQINQHGMDFRQGTTGRLIEQEQNLLQQINDLQNSLKSEQEKPFGHQNRVQISTLKEELELARQNHGKLMVQLKLANPEYISLMSLDTLNLQEVQTQVLASQTTLVTYIVMADYTLAWVINQDEFDFVRLNITANELIDQIRYLRALTTDKDFDTEVATHLYDVLFAPLKPHIANNNLIIVPHHVLHYLPFATLWNRENQRYLIEDYSITYAPSASALKFVVDKRNTSKDELLLMGSPDRSLRAAKGEVDAISQLYNTIPLVYEQATERQVYQQANQIDILHLAAHAVYDPFNPLSTRIELAGDEEFDGYLEVHEVYKLDLANANLVVLSACATALGDQSVGDEIVGLTRAFLYAGAPSVITSLWNVDDESTAYLMTQFYTYYRDGMGVAAALRQAQLDTMIEYPEPYYWAAFTLHGDGGWSNPSSTSNILTPADLAKLEEEFPALAWLYRLLQQVEVK